MHRASNFFRSLGNSAYIKNKTKTFIINYNRKTLVILITPGSLVRKLRGQPLLSMGCFSHSIDFLLRFVNNET